MNATVLAVVAAAGGIPLGTLAGIWAARRKVEAETRHTDVDADSTTVATALSLIGPMRDRIQQLEEELIKMRDMVDRMRDRIDELESHDRAKTYGIGVLTRQITRLGATAAWPEQEQQP